MNVRTIFLLLLFAACSSHHEAADDGAADASVDTGSSSDAFGVVDASVPVDAGDAFSCDSLSDSDVLALAYDEDALIPEDLIWLGEGQRVWSETCSLSGSANDAAAATHFAFTAEIETSSAHPRFYETTVRGAGETASARGIYRSPRCDYFDGSILAGGPHDNDHALSDLTGMLSYLRVSSGEAGMGVDVENVSRHHSQCDATGCDTTVCVVHVSWQDQVCDVVTLLERHDRITVDGQVTFGDASVLRQMDGPVATGWMLEPVCRPNQFGR